MRGLAIDMTDLAALFGGLASNRNGASKPFATITVGPEGTTISVTGKHILDTLVKMRSLLPDDGELEDDILGLGGDMYGLGDALGRRSGADDFGSSLADILRRGNFPGAQRNGSRDRAQYAVRACGDHWHVGESGAITNQVEAERYVGALLSNGSIGDMQYHAIMADVRASGMPTGAPEPEQGADGAYHFTADGGLLVLYDPNGNDVDYYDNKAEARSYVTSLSEQGSLGEGDLERLMADIDAADLPESDDNADEPADEGGADREPDVAEPVVEQPSEESSDVAAV